MAGTTVSGNKTVTLDKIARYATITSASNFTDEGAPSCKWSNPASSNVTVDVGVYWDSSTVLIPYETVTGTSGTKTFTLTNDQKEAIYAKLSTKTEETVYYYVRTTLSDGTKYYHKLAKKVSLAGDLTPTFTGSITPDGATQLLTFSDKIWIKGYTDLYYNFTDIETKKGATVKSYLAICGYDKLYTSSGVLENIEENVAGLYLHDSRGNAAAYYINDATLLEYVDLTCNLKKVDMKVITDADGNSTVTATLTVNGNAYSGSFDGDLTYNQATLSYRYKAEDDTEYSNWIEISTNPTLKDNKYSATIEITGLNYQKAYTFQVGISDLLHGFFELGKKTSREVTDKAIPVFDWSKEDFNFNVPVYMQGLSLGGLVKAMTTEYPLTVTFERGTNWTTGTNETLTASLIGNMIRFNYFLYRSSDTGDGNLVNEEVCTITFNHGGKVKSAYNTSFSSGSTGSVATFGTSGMTKVKDASGNETDSITFKVNLAATGGAAKSFSGFFFVPVTLNLNNY
ncbi:MAG: hypothetical protein E7536_03090 [Ruminococcaceae bacterium]|nr:hypothetical protein [Oscillospiraceae bacterium]